MLRISLHCTIYHRHPWNMAENSTQWSRWPRPMPHLQSNLLTVKAYSHDWQLCPMKYVSHDMSRRSQLIALLAAKNVAEIQSWTRLPHNCTERWWIHMLVGECISKTKVWALQSYNTHLQIYWRSIAWPKSTFMARPRTQEVHVQTPQPARSPLWRHAPCRCTAWRADVTFFSTSAFFGDQAILGGVKSKPKVQTTTR